MLHVSGKRARKTCAENVRRINGARSCGMETDWKERFKAVVGLVYRVLWDAEDTMRELKEHLYAKGKIFTMQYNTWPQTRDPSDANARALDDLTTRLCNMTNAVMNADLEPIVPKSAVPAAFEGMKACIEEMRAQVPIVEQQYDGDCGVLKPSMEAALTALQTYLEDEKTEKKTVAQLVQDLGDLVDAQ